MMRAITALIKYIRGGKTSTPEKSIINAPIDPPTSKQLQTAVINQDTEEVRRILAFGNANVVTTAAAYLIQYYSAEHIEFLVSHKPPRELFTRVICLDRIYTVGTLLHFTIVCGYDTRRALRALAPFVSIHEYTDMYNSVITTAINADKIWIIDDLIQLGASLNGLPNPPLYTNIWDPYRKITTIQYLIDRGALPTKLSIMKLLEGQYTEEWLEIVFRPRAVDITNVDIYCQAHIHEVNPCSTIPQQGRVLCNNIPRGPALVVTESLHLHLRKHPEYLHTAGTSYYDKSRMLELLVKNGADPYMYYAIVDAKVNPYIERGRLYRIAIYAYLCAREAYGRDIAGLIARQILKLRPGH